MNKAIKYILGVLAIVAVVYFSLDIQKLDEYKAANSEVKFDATEFAQQFWDNELAASINNATDVQTAIQQLEINPEIAFEKYGHKLGISKTYYLILKGSGIIESVEEEYLLVRIDENKQIQVATDFIFGNAIRDGSGKVDINQFVNMTDFNNVSVALNKMAKEKVVARLKKSVKAGMQIEFTGAAELNEDNIEVTKIRVIPIAAKLSDG
jgi:predicted lipoprotein